MLGNRCKGDADDDGDDVEGTVKDASFTTDVVEGSPLVAGSWVISPVASLFCSSAGAGAGAMGTKNLPASAGFTDGVAGDWKEFVSAPPLPPAPPLLNVSTYLNGKKWN